MRTLKIVNGDIIFDEQRNLMMVEGREEEMQSIERLLTTNIEEWFLNIEHGLDYRKLQKKGISDEEIHLTVMHALAQEERIQEVESIDIVRNEKDRTVAIGFKCVMKSGEEVTGEEVLNIG